MWGEGCPQILYLLSLSLYLSIYIYIYLNNKIYISIRYIRYILSLSLYIYVLFNHCFSVEKCTLLIITFKVYSNLETVFEPNQSKESPYPPMCAVSLWELMTGFAMEKGWLFSYEWPAQENRKLMFKSPHFSIIYKQEVLQSKNHKKSWTRGSGSCVVFIGQFLCKLLQSDLCSS